MQKPFTAALFLCTCLFALPIGAQKAPEIKPDFSGESSVVEEMATKVVFEDDGTSTREQTTRVRVQNEAGVKSWGIVVFAFDSDIETVDIDYVRVRKPDGSVVATPLDDVRALDAEITRDAPLYSDLREKDVPVRGLTTGDTLEYSCHWHATKAITPGQFWMGFSFTRGSVVWDETVQVSVPADRAVKVRGPDGPQTPKLAGGHRIYAWSNKNLVVEKNNGKAAREAALGRSPAADIQVSSFQTWDEVGQWYWNLQADRVAPSPEIRAKAAELTKGAADDAAKVKAIYDFVSTKYRYIGVDFGIGRYRPHRAADVLANNFGDCKDKQTLLASLLAASGVTIYPALISTNHVLDPDMPWPGQFNHVIGYVPQVAGGLWLDTTPELTEEGLLLPGLRRKQALVISSERSARLVDTPTAPPQASFEVFNVDAKLADDGTLTATMVDTARNDAEVLIREAFRQRAPSQYQELIQQISYRLGFAGTVSDVKTGAPEATAEPFKFSYNYLRKNYPDWADHRFTVPGLPFPMPEQDDNSPHEPIYLGEATKLESDTRVELPSGYSPMVPANVDIVRDYAEYRTSYSRDGKALVARRTLTVKLREVPVSELDDYKKFVEGMRKDIDQYVSTASPQNELMNPETRAADFFRSSIEDLPDSKVDEANRMEREAQVAGSQNNSPKAISAMREAVEADPKFTRGWLRLGAIELALHEPDDAVASFHSAIESDPTQPLTYKAAASALAFMRRPDDAIKLWRDLLKKIPDDPDAPAALGHLLVAQKRYADAIPSLQTALKLHPDDVFGSADLAIAYMLSGDTEKGHAMLQTTMQLSPAPVLLNNIAWALADSNQDLTDALEYAEKAVRQEEEGSQKTDVSKLTNTDLHHGQSLAEFWDTLGWAHFRLGHMDQAEDCLSAAWELSQYGSIGDHLAQVYERLHKTKEAVHMYLLAVATLERPLPADRQEAIRLHVRVLDPNANLATGPGIGTVTPTDELVQMRTIKLPRIVQGTADAEFFLLFGPGAKVEGADYISGTDRLEKETKTLSTMKFPVKFPEGSSAHVLRRGLLMCTDLSGCQFIFIPLDSMRSVN